MNSIASLYDESAKRQDIHRAGVGSIGRFMHQKRESPPFSFEKRFELYGAFSDEHKLHTSIDMKETNKKVLRVIFILARTIHCVVFKQISEETRLTYVWEGHAFDGGARLFQLLAHMEEHQIRSRANTGAKFNGASVFERLDMHLPQVVGSTSTKPSP